MKIIIDGKPIPKQRHKHARRGKHVIVYDPQERDKNRVRRLISEGLIAALNSSDKLTSLEAGEICRSQVFHVQFSFFLPINSSDSVMVKNKKLWGIIEPNCKPDYDNTEKFYLDCASGVLWPDDRMIVRGVSQKRYDIEPRVEIVVTAKKEISLPPKAEKVITAFSPKEFKELIEDAKRIAILDTEPIGDLEGDVLQQWLETAAGVLSCFSLKYSGKLKKIASYGDVITELTSIADCKLRIDRGEYAT